MNDLIDEKLVQEFLSEFRDGYRAMIHFGVPTAYYNYLGKNFKAQSWHQLLDSLVDRNNPLEMKWISDKGITLP